MSFDQDTLQNALLMAGLTPRDLQKIIEPHFHFATLYLFMKKGHAGPETKERLRELQKFLEKGVASGWFPVAIKKGIQRQTYLLEKFDSWKSSSFSEDCNSHAV